MCSTLPSISSLLVDIPAREGRPVYVAAPMVRYSKLPYRELVRSYGSDIVYTPMMMAESFAASSKCRDGEFTTADGDERGLVAQFAANDATHFADAAMLVLGHAQGVGLNCGCPQRWVMKAGLGSSMIERPELVADCVRQTRNRLGHRDGEMSVSVKIRLRATIEESVDLCRQVEAAGASFVTVHGRTPRQRAEPVDLDAIRTIREALHVPVVANGDCRSRAQADEIARETGVNGVMSARGLLANPAMHAGHAHTPKECVRRWVRLCLERGQHYSLLHHHLMFMLDEQMSKAQRRVFNRLTNTPAVLTFLDEQMHCDCT